MSHMFMRPPPSSTRIYLAGMFQHPFNGGFDQDIAKWDVSSVNDMDSIFESFNQDLVSCWFVTNVAPFNWGDVFIECYKIHNQDISNLDVSNVQDMTHVFNGGASSCNQDQSSWNTTLVSHQWRCF
jgi:surface protein